MSVRSGRDGAVSPSSEARFSFGSPSPNSSGGASSISAMYSAGTSCSSATSSTLTPNNVDRFNRKFSACLQGRLRSMLRCIKQDSVCFWIRSNNYIADVGPNVRNYYDLFVYCEIVNRISYIFLNLHILDSYIYKLAQPRARLQKSILH